MRVRAIAWMLIGVGVLGSWPARGAVGQEVALAARSPRFLYAPSGAAPVEIDASRAAVLRHIVSLRVEQPTVGRVLTAIERQTGLTFAYGNDFPTNRPVTLRADSITVVSALAAVLYDAGVDVVLSPGGHVALVKRGAAPPVGSIAGRVTDAKTQTALAGATVVVEGTRHSATTGSDGRYRIADLAPGTYTVRARYIGYAPATVSAAVTADQETTADFGLEKSAQQLNEVVTTGTVVPTEVKALPTPITVITADQIARKNIQHVDEIFRGDVPGVLAWNQGGVFGYYSLFATIRGSSALAGFNSIKVYVDGIEMANENFLVDFDPSSIERIEIIRGPQASTLYGSQALNGVVQIFTKKGVLGLARPEIEAKASAGVSETQFADHAPATQDYALQLRGGSDRASYNIGGGYRSLGAYAPESYDRTRSIFGGAHVATGPVSLELSVHYFDRPFGAAINPLLPAAVPQQHNYSEDQREQTYAATLSYRLKPWWTHTLTAGADRHSFDEYTRQPQLTTPADTSLFLYTGDATRVSVGYSTTLGVRVSDAISTTWTAGLDRWTSSSSSFYVSQTPTTVGVLTVPNGAFFFLTRLPQFNNGYFGQVQVGLQDAVFLTAGLRGDKSSTVGSSVGTIWAPRVGLSAVHQWGNVSGKIRGSYGKGIRPPGYGFATADVQPGFIQLANPGLRPEQQSGFDAGLELYFGSRASLEATYYNQRATDLIALEQRAFDPSTFTGTYQYVNLSRVKNTGWEFAGSLALGAAFTLNGTFAITNSTVVDPGPGYSGIYLAGDRVLGVPRSTGGATLTYALSRTTVSAGLTYGGSWIDYDLLRQDTDFYVNQVFTNPQRSYLINYPSFARLTASVAQRFTSYLSGFVQVNNLTNQQTGEINNINITPGRTSIVGLRFRY